LIIANLMHFGMVIVGLPYSHAGQMTLDEIVSQRDRRGSDGPRESAKAAGYLAFAGLARFF
jgi:hypothetical protein